MVETTNLERFLEILYIYNSVFSETRTISSKIYKEKLVLPHYKFFLVPFIFISPLRTSHLGIQCVHKVSLQFQKFLTKANERIDKWKFLQNFNIAFYSS